VNTFSYYDQVLDTALLVGALPARVADIADDLDRYFAAARGNAEVAPLEMTKWFDTNYHYLVPEIGTNTRFSLNPAKVLGELEEARAQGIPARPVFVGQHLVVVREGVHRHGVEAGRDERLQVSRRSVAAIDSSSVRSMRPAQYFSTARLSGEPMMVAVNGATAVMTTSFDIRRDGHHQETANRGRPVGPLRPSAHSTMR
jgi:hypothetical protein